jgi:hypothetical protein
MKPLAPWHIDIVMRAHHRQPGDADARRGLPPATAFRRPPH